MAQTPCTELLFIAMSVRTAIDVLQAPSNRRVTMSALAGCLGYKLLWTVLDTARLSFRLADMSFSGLQTQYENWPAMLAFCDSVGTDLSVTP